MEARSPDRSLVRGQHVVAVAALIVREPANSEDEPRILAMRRAPDNRAGPGLWETLSGRVEHGEEPFSAVAREIAEECGLGVALESRPYAAYAASRLGLPMIVISFRARYLAGQVQLSHEHDAYAWLSASEFRARSSLLALVSVVERALSEPLL